jgi:hypothetical protein
MLISTVAGPRWRIEDAQRKLSCRARLPGARVFDLAADSLRRAKDGGLAALDRLHLALPASWLVNSPAVSPVLRRWALAPQRETWLQLVEALGGSPLDREAIDRSVQALGTEPYAVEAISKVAALLVPDAVPLMPLPARTFVLGEAASEPRAFVAMVSWLTAEARAHSAELDVLAAAHTEVPLSAAQVLDRLLWFDSEGYRHFASDGFAPPALVP